MRTLQFETLDIDRLPGIPRGNGFRIEGLSPGINLVHGPNGAGKSLTGQSLLALIWPAATTLAHPTITGRWKLDDHMWDVDLEAGHATWRCDGGVADPPVLPSAESRSHHWLGLRELLGDSGPDAAATTAFAQRIAREMLGGYDLDTAGQRLNYDGSPSKPQKLHGKLRESKTSLNEAQNDERRLHGESSTISAMEDACEKARAADEERRRLERALAYRDAADAEADINAKLSGFDEQLDHLTGNERERLDELRGDLTIARKRLTDADADMLAAQHAQAETALHGDGVPDEVLHAAAAALRDMRDAHASVRQADADHEAAKTKLQTHRQKIAPDISNADLDALDDVPSDEMARYARDLVTHREQAARLQVRRQHLTDTDQRLAQEARDLGDRTPEQLERGLRALSSWLSAPPPTATAPRGWIVPLLVAAAFIAVFAAAAALLHHWLWLLGVVPAGIFAWFSRPQVPAAAGIDHRATYEQEYTRQDLVQPDNWNAEAVQETWSALSDLCAKASSLASAMNRHAQDKAALEDESREVATREQGLAQRRAALESALGFTIDDSSDDWLHVLGEHLASYRSAQSDAASANAALENNRTAYRNSLARFNQQFEPFVDHPAQEHTEAEGQHADLQTRARNYREQRSRARTAQQARDQEMAAIEETQEKVDTLLEALGLDEASEDQLDAWLEQRASYHDLVKQREETRFEQTRIAREIGEDHPALGYDRAKIQSERDRMARQAAELSDLDQKLGAVRNEVARAKSAHSVEDAQREVDRCRTDLSDALEKAEQQVAGQAVLDWLRSEATDRSQPAILRKANDLFRSITHGRYELRVDDSGSTPGFIARDTSYEIDKSLDQLSAGERVQLLVAVRLGFLEQEEGGVRLPLVLDETLGTTDDERAKAIIDTVIEVCRTGRQVFYFTAQPDEVGKWRARMEGVTDVELGEFNLGVLRGLAERDAAPIEIVRPDEPQLPAPDGADHAEYGRMINAPGLSPALPTGLVHLWHLVDDPEVLHALLARRISQLGPFESLIGRGGFSIDGIDETTIETINARARVLRAVFDAANVGRGRRVDRAALEATEVVSKSFIDRLTDHAEECGGDAARLMAMIEAGEIKGWRSKNNEPLREHLEREGYLDPESPLSRDDIYRRGLAAGDDGRDHAWLGRLIDALPLQGVATTEPAP